LKDVVDEQAEELKDKCRPNVFDIEDIGKGCSVFCFIVFLMSII